jgi:hypothetical protein
MRSSLLVVAVLLAAAGCAADGGEEAERLAGACQVKRCACGPAGWSAFSAGGGKPVRWRENGEAYCEDGLRLHLIQPKPGQTERL